VGINLERCQRCYIPRISQTKQWW